MIKKKKLSELYSNYHWQIKLFFIKNPLLKNHNYIKFKYFF